MYSRTCVASTAALRPQPGSECIRTAAGSLSARIAHVHRRAAGAGAAALAGGRWAGDIISEIPLPRDDDTTHKHANAVIGV